MSWVSKGLKKLGGAVTKAASFVPGPIGLIGSAANAAINKKPIVSSVAGDLGRNSKIAATLLPLALTGGAAGASGVAGAVSAATGGIPKINPLQVRDMTPSVESLVSGVSSPSATMGSSSSGKSGSMFGLNLSDLLQLGSGALSAYGGYQAGKKQDKAMARQQQLSDQAMQFAMGQYNERAPYRKLGADLALNQTPEDVSGLFQTSNPFANRYRKLGA